ncbi:MAG: hypothetical protein KAH08_04830 [Methylococcales bacterium]|nr:hypothetical protein [Methylococcales bacterium]MCK5898094.1 hypothetical protein [Methylococcales bacterium]
MTTTYTSTKKTKKLAANLPTLISIICNLMTCYAMHPCEEVAKKINRHMNALLESSSMMELGEWRPIFIQLQIQWDTIMQRYQHHDNLNTSAKS